MPGSPAVVSPQHESLAEASQQDAAAAVSQQADPAAGAAADVAADGPAAAAGVVAEGAAAARGTLWVLSSASPAVASVGDALPVDGGAASRGQGGVVGGVGQHGVDLPGRTVRVVDSRSKTARRTVAPALAPKLARAPHTHRACRIVATPFAVEMETAAGAASSEEDT